MFSVCRNMMVLRVHGDDLMFGGGGGGGGGNSVITHSPRIPQMEMMKVHIPFTFKLHESFKSTYAGKSSPFLRFLRVAELDPRLGQPLGDLQTFAFGVQCVARYCCVL